MNDDNCKIFNESYHLNMTTCICCIQNTTVYIYSLVIFLTVCYILCLFTIFAFFVSFNNIILVVSFIYVFPIISRVLWHSGISVYVYIGARAKIDNH